MFVFFLVEGVVDRFARKVARSRRMGKGEEEGGMGKRRRAGRVGFRVLLVCMHGYGLGSLLRTVLRNMV